MSSRRPHRTTCACARADGCVMAAGTYDDIVSRWRREKRDTADGLVPTVAAPPPPPEAGSHSRRTAPCWRKASFFGRAVVALDSRTRRVQSLASADHETRALAAAAAARRPPSSRAPTTGRALATAVVATALLRTRGHQRLWPTILTVTTEPRRRNREEETAKRRLRKKRLRKNRLRNKRLRNKRLRRRCCERRDSEDGAAKTVLREDCEDETNRDGPTAPGSRPGFVRAAPFSLRMHRSYYPFECTGTIPSNAPERSLRRRCTL